MTRPHLNAFQKAILLRVRKSSQRSRSCSPGRGFSPQDRTPGMKAFAPTRPTSISLISAGRDEVLDGGPYYRRIKPLSLCHVPAGSVKKRGAVWRRIPPDERGTDQVLYVKIEFLPFFMSPPFPSVLFHFLLEIGTNLFEFFGRTTDLLRLDRLEILRHRKAVLFIE